MFGSLSLCGSKGHADSLNISPTYSYTNKKQMSFHTNTSGIKRLQPTSDMTGNNRLRRTVYEPVRQNDRQDNPMHVSRDIVGLKSTHPDFGDNHIPILRPNYIFLIKLCETHT